MSGAGGCGGATEPAASTSVPASGGSSAASEPVELVFWTMWDGGDVTVASKIFDEYNSTHPDVHIDFQQQDFNQFATKLKTGMMSGQGRTLPSPTSAALSPACRRTIC